MNTPTRLGLFAAALGLVFAGAFTAADAVVPESSVGRWPDTAKGHEMNTGKDSHNQHAAADTTDASIRGVTSARAGFILSPTTAPKQAGDAGELSFQIRDTAGDAVTRFATSHEKALHLIVVRTDGAHFRHVHPTLDAKGSWSMPWSWAAAGTYRIFADFVPADASDPVTLTRTVEVAGDFTPAPEAPTNTASVEGFTVTLTGDLVVGSGSPLTFTVTKDGERVTNLQPYLGAFGHLVALREGDMAYLHVHPEGDEPAAGELSGPSVEFVAEAPTPGRYLLYLDFRVDGQVHTAAFVVDAGHTNH